MGILEILAGFIVGLGFGLMIGGYIVHRQFQCYGIMRKRLFHRDEMTHF